jgi:hypothetical protein
MSDAISKGLASGFLQLNKVLYLTIVFMLASCGGSDGDSGTNFYKVIAEVSGLNGSLTLSTNGISQTVTQDQSANQLVLLEEGVSYNVVITRQPVGQQCSVSNGSGVVGQGDINVKVICENIDYTVTGNVSGLVNQLVLAVEGGTSLTINTSGAFDSGRSYAHLETYLISIETQPTGQACTLINGSGDINAAYITNVVITCINRPIALAVFKQTDEDQPLQSVLTSEVVDVNSQVFSITVQPAHGLLSLDDSSTGTYTYTPAENYFGLDFFTFKVNDGTEDSLGVNVVITINAVNDAPVANGRSFNVNVNETIVASAGSDVEGGTLTLSLISAPTKGKVVYFSESGSYTYTPGDTGEDQFTFTLDDDTHTSNQATLHFNVLSLSDLTETSNNNVKESATQHYQNSTITADLSDSSDIDWYQFDAFENGSVQLNFSSEISTGNEDFQITVVNSSGDILTSSLSGSGSILHFSVADSESYFIRIEEGSVINSNDYQILLEYYPSSIATLSWTVPFENVDGSSYNNRKGYVIYYGTSANNLTKTSYRDDPTLLGGELVQLDKIIPNLRLGSIYYFAITTINDQDIESEYSNVISKVFSLN